jgi:hypothetical protein
MCPYNLPLSNYEHAGDGEMRVINDGGGAPTAMGQGVG